ncbi:MAG: hypothetical protein CMF25_03945 [Kangiellaceae bacterium]|mgnify:CR=1 FL=1|jgi:hypothetical protein|nr:hypothetical protein [Kangiellaceae bacterium]|tara:strand:+ start:3719 stop:3997 length:279 start_codon:yes stop_codon:yes gene_type:complete
MEESIGFLLAWLLVELIFWGCMYFTGFALVPLFSFGKLKPDGLSRLESGRVAKRQSGFKVFDREGIKYLGAWGVCAVGLVFWIAVLVAVIVL